MGTFWLCAISNLKINTLQSFLNCVQTNWAKNVRLAANESFFEYLSNDLGYQLFSCTAKNKNQIWKVPIFISFEEFTVHTQILTPYLLFTIKSKIIDVNSWDLWHCLHLMTLFWYLTKKNIKKSFYSWEMSYRTAVSFFMVRSVAYTSTPIH